MKQRGIIFLLITVLSIVGYGAFVFAAPLLGSGGFTPGETLNPDCEPGDAGYDCKVKSGWLLGGNSGTDGGVDDFIGTVDAQDFVIKTDNVQVAKFGAGAGIGLGYTIPDDALFLGSHALSPEATGLASTAIGSGSQASGVASMAIGFGSIYTGKLNTATGVASFSFGLTNTVSATNNFAFGEDNIVGGTGSDSYAFGEENNVTSVNGDSYAFGIGNTVSSDEIGFSFGRDNVTSGTSAFTFGIGNTASGIGSIVLGNSAIASGNYSTAFQSGIASGMYSISGGFMGTEASGIGSIAFGQSNIASGVGSMVLGGENSTATGLQSVSWQQSNNANGQNATAFGSNNEASGENSVTFGIGNIAQSLTEIAIGSYGTEYIPANGAHDEWDTSDRLFTIGNGETDMTRSDAFTILKNGKTGIGYDNFETTNSNALLQVNGGILSSSLTSCDLLETDSDGLFGCGSFPTNPITIQNTSSIFSTGLTGTGSGSDAIHAIFMGVGAGQAVTNGDYSIFLGYLAGGEAIGSHRGVFIGEGAGYRSTDAYDSIFIGADTGRYDAGSGYGSPKANDSIFIGRGAGFNLTDAALDNSSGGTSIVIGRYGSTGGYSNSIALGTGALNTATNQFMIGSSSISPIDETRINGSASTQCTITTGTGIACTSDERVKTNIEDLPTDILDQLSNIRTVTYNWLGNPSGKQQIGFLAQNLEQVFPQLVETDHEGMKSVYYAQMTPILIEAVKELNLKISDIENFASAENKTLLNNLIAWLGDALNGLTKVHVDQELCIGEICINESDLQQFKDWQSGISGGFGYGYGGN